MFAVYLKDFHNGLVRFNINLVTGGLKAAPASSSKKGNVWVHFSAPKAPPNINVDRTKQYGSFDYYDGIPTQNWSCVTFLPRDKPNKYIQHLSICSLKSGSKV